MGKNSFIFMWLIWREMIKKIPIKRLCSQSEQKNYILLISFLTHVSSLFLSDSIFPICHSFHYSIQKISSFRPCIRMDFVRFSEYQIDLKQFLCVYVFVYVCLNKQAQRQCVFCAILVCAVICKSSPMTFLPSIRSGWGSWI